MSMFISKALRRAEVFLEQVDESVAQASRRLVVEGATGAVHDDDEDLDLDEDEQLTSTPFSRASSIPTAESRAQKQQHRSSSSSVPFALAEEDLLENNEDIADAWGDDIDIEVDSLMSPAAVEDPLAENKDSGHDDDQSMMNNDSVDAGTGLHHPDVNVVNDKRNESSSAVSSTTQQITTDTSQGEALENKIGQVAKQTVHDQYQQSVADQGMKHLQPPQVSQVDIQQTILQQKNMTSEIQNERVSIDSKPRLPTTHPSKSNPQLSSTPTAPIITSSSSTTTVTNSTVTILPVKQQRRFTATPAPNVPLPAADAEFTHALQEENSDLRTELETVDKELEDSRRDRTKLVKNLKRMKEIVSEMDETLRDKSAEARQLNDEMIQLKEQLSTLQKTKKETETKGQDELQSMHAQLSTEIKSLESRLSETTMQVDSFQLENNRLKEALLQGHEVELATADGARQEASQAHKAYELEAKAHQQTRKQAQEREENLQGEAALAAVTLASAQRKAEECTILVSESKSAQRAAESKLSNVTQARDAAFARIEDLDQALRLFERNEGNEAPGQIDAKAMQETVSELENALEAKNVELNRLEGELEAIRAKSRRDHTSSPRAPGTPANNGTEGSHEVELKLRHMADAALRKQAQLEVLRSENRAVQHQLTTERKRTREAQAMAAAASSSRQSIRGGFRGILDGGEDGRGADIDDRMYGLRDGPLARFRTPRNWPKPIAQVITGMDRFSAQALAFLRKEPLLRIVLIIYVVTLHLFVYSLLHWHVGTVTGSVDDTHGRVASAAK